MNEINIVASKGLTAKIAEIKIRRLFSITGLKKENRGY